MRTLLWDVANIDQIIDYGPFDTLITNGSRSIDVGSLPSSISGFASAIALAALRQNHVHPLPHHFRCPQQTQRSPVP